MAVYRAQTPETPSESPKEQGPLGSLRTQVGSYAESAARYLPSAAQTQDVMAMAFDGKPLEELTARDREVAAAEAEKISEKEKQGAIIAARERLGKALDSVKYELRKEEVTGEARAKLETEKQRYEKEYDRLLGIERNLMRLDERAMSYGREGWRAFRNADWKTKLLIVGGGLLAIPLVKPVLKGLWSIFTAPFRFIGKRLGLVKEAEGEAKNGGGWFSKLLIAGVVGLGGYMGYQWLKGKFPDLFTAADAIAGAAAKGTEAAGNVVDTVAEKGGAALDATEKKVQDVAQEIVGSPAADTAREDAQHVAVQNEAKLVAGEILEGNRDLKEEVGLNRRQDTNHEAALSEMLSPDSPLRSLTVQDLRQVISGEKDAVELLRERLKREPNELQQKLFLFLVAWADENSAETPEEAKLTLGELLDRESTVARIFAAVRKHVSGLKLQNFNPQDVVKVAAEAVKGGFDSLVRNPRLLERLELLQGAADSPEQRKAIADFAEYCVAHSGDTLDAALGSARTETTERALAKLQTYFQRKDVHDYVALYLHDKSRDQAYIKALEDYLPTPGKPGSFTVRDALELFTAMNTAESGESLPQNLSRSKGIGVFLTQLKVIEMLPREQRNKMATYLAKEYLTRPDITIPPEAKDLLVRLFGLAVEVAKNKVEDTVGDAADSVEEGLGLEDDDEGNTPVDYVLAYWKWIVGGAAVLYGKGSLKTWLRTRPFRRLERGSVTPWYKRMVNWKGITDSELQLKYGIYPESRARAEIQSSRYYANRGWLQRLPIFRRWHERHSNHEFAKVAIQDLQGSKHSVTDLMQDIRVSRSAAERIKSLANEAWKNSESRSTVLRHYEAILREMKRGQAEARLAQNATSEAQTTQTQRPAQEVSQESRAATTVAAGAAPVEVVQEVVTPAPAASSPAPEIVTPAPAAAPAATTPAPAAAAPEVVTQPTPAPVEAPKPAAAPERAAETTIIDELKVLQRQYEGVGEKLDGEERAGERTSLENEQQAIRGRAKEILRKLHGQITSVSDQLAAKTADLGAGHPDLESLQNQLGRLQSEQERAELFAREMGVDLGNGDAGVTADVTSPRPSDDTSSRIEFDPTGVNPEPSAASRRLAPAELATLHQEAARYGVDIRGKTNVEVEQEVQAKKRGLGGRRG